MNGPRMCSECEHGALSGSGVWCTFFREEVAHEVKVAMECAEYDPVPWARSRTEAKSEAKR